MLSGDMLLLAFFSLQLKHAYYFIQTPVECQLIKFLRSCFTINLKEEEKRWPPKMDNFVTSIKNHMHSIFQRILVIFRQLKKIINVSEL
jgi:hypothetical protein